MHVEIIKQNCGYRGISESLDYIQTNSNKVMGDPTARHSRAGRLFKWIAYFKTIYGMSVNLLDIFHIKAFSELDLSLLANAPLFMLGVFLVLNSIGLLFRAKLVWAISIILLLIALIYTLHFYPG